MDKNNAYSLALYEKALPAGMEFERMLSDTLRLGFDRLELSVDESDARLSRLDWNDAQKSRLYGAIRDSGVPIRTLCLSAHRKYPLGSSDPGIRSRSLEIMKKALDLAGSVGITVIQLAGYDVYYEPGTDRTRAYFLDNLRVCADMAARAGIALGFETMETPFMDTVAKAMACVNAIGSPWLGVYPDIGNLENAAVLYGQDSVADLLLGRGHTFAMHVKETRPGVYRDLRFGGGGHTRYDDCLRAAAGMGVRLFTGEFWYQKGTDYEAEVLHAARFLRGKLDLAFSG